MQCVQGSCDVGEEGEEREVADVVVVAPDVLVVNRIGRGAFATKKATLSAQERQNLLKTTVAESCLRRWDTRRVWLWALLIIRGSLSRLPPL